MHNVLNARRPTGLGKGQSRLCGTLWPNGEFSMGFQHARSLGHFHENRLMKAISGERVEGDVLEEGCPEWELGLVSSPYLSQDDGGGKVRAVRGSRGMSVRARRFVRNAGAVLQLGDAVNCNSFLTCTLPPCSKDEWKEIASRWSEVLRRFNQELVRDIRRAGLPPLLVGVTEIQEDRFRETGEAALHYHVSFRGKRNRFQKKWAVSVHRARYLWRNICVDMFPFLDRDSFAAATRIEAVQVSVGAYLSKYMTKGGEILDAYLEAGYAPPSSWYNCSSGLRDAVLSGCVQTESVMGGLWRVCERGGEGLAYYNKCVYVDMLGHEIKAGYTGRVDDLYIPELAENRKKLRMWMDEQMRTGGR